MSNARKLADLLDSAGDVKLANLDNAVRTTSASDLTSGTVPTARLGSGTANNSVFLRGDNTWAAAGSTSASDLTSGTLPIARIADGAVTAAKVAADVATQAELDTVSTVASAALPKAGGTMTGSLLITAHTNSITTTGNDDNLQLISTDNDALVGPNLLLYRNSGDPADGDVLGSITYDGRQDGGGVRTYGEIKAILQDASDGTEDGKIEINTIVAGSSTRRLSISSADSETVFNDDGIDLDFRVESDTFTHALFVDGATGNVGIREASTGAALHMKDIGGTSVGLALRHATNDTGKGFMVRFKGGDTGGNVVDYGEIKNEIMTRGVGTQSGDFVFKNAISGTLTEVARITSGGGLGVGTSSVAGKIHAEGTVTDGGLTGLMISNRGTGTSAYDAIAFRLSDTSGTHWTAASLEVKKENQWTSTAATRDSRMSLRVIKDDAWVDALTLRADGRMQGPVKLNSTSGSGRWANSGVWKTIFDLSSHPSGTLYLCEAAIQSLAGYTASMLVFKTGASSGGEYQIMQINNTSGYFQMSGHNVQYKQGSGADQTNTSGFQRVTVVSSVT